MSEEELGNGGCDSFYYMKSEGADKKRFADLIHGDLVIHGIMSLFDLMTDRCSGLVAETASHVWRVNFFLSQRGFCTGFIVYAAYSTLLGTALCRKTQFEITYNRAALCQVMLVQKKESSNRALK